MEVSAIYNIVSGMRIVIANLSTAPFGDADDAMQIATLGFIAETLERRHQPTQDLIRRLRGIAEQGFWRFVWSVIRRGGLPQ